MQYTIPPTLIRCLYTRLHIPHSHTTVSPKGENWIDSVSTVLQNQGFSTTVWTTSVITIAEHIQLGYPALSVTPEGEWILLEEYSWKWIAHYNLSQEKRIWTSVQALHKKFGQQPCTWIMIEPGHAKSILSSTETHLSPIQRMSNLIQLEKLDIVLITILGMLLGIFSLTIPLSIQTLINWVAFGGLVQPIVALIVFVSCILFISAIVSLFQRLVVERLERRIFLRIVEDMSQQFNHMTTSAMDTMHIPDVANRFFDILTIQKSLRTFLISGIGACLQVLVAICVLALYHPSFIVIDILMVLGMVWIFKRNITNGIDTAIVESKSKYTVATWLETIGNQSVPFRLGSSTIAREETDNRLRKWLKNRVQHFTVFFWQYSMAYLFQVCMSVFVLYWGGTLVISGEITIGQFVAAEFVITNAFLGYIKFMDKLDTGYDLLASLDKIGHVLDIEVDTITGIHDNTNQENVFRLENVALIPNSIAVSGEIKAGKMYYFLCPIDASIRSIAEIFLGSRIPNKGIVYKNEIVMSLRNPQNRYSDVLLVSSDAIFDGSIYDNITMGHATIAESEIWNILHDIGIDTIVLEKNGLHSKITKDIPLLYKGVLLARCLSHDTATIIIHSFFEGLPPEWIQRWLCLLHKQQKTVIILETIALPHKDIESDFSHLVHFGELYEHFT